MTQKAVFLALIISGLLACKSDHNEKLIINSGIIEDVKNNCIPFSNDPELGSERFQSNKVYMKHFEDDELLGDTFQEPGEMLFNCTYFYLGDTLKIHGVFGMFGGFGFKAEIIDNKSIVYHFVISDDWPLYSQTADGELIQRMKVVCNEWTLTLDRQPEVTDHEPIFGIVTFNSNEFYHSNPNIEAENSRTKLQTSMKIYFKSYYMNPHEVN
jgi:hypothetical protein